MIAVCARCGAKNRVNAEAAGGKQAVCGRCGAPLSMSATSGAGTPLVVSDGSFAGDVLGQKEVPVLLDCWAPWCGPCRMITPIMNQLAAEANGRYVIAKLNVDENPRTAAQFRIQSIPTMLIFKNGQLIDRLVGAQPKEAIAARLAAHV
ncbi:MAG TPA: thioredoxin [Pyrinomonadaceae bacterium]|nr:thioredoxin [Pyrinomonadaceae bacterium]